MKTNQFDEIINKTKESIKYLIDYNSVCICGSSKFCDLIAVIKWEIEKQGIMATGLHLLPDWYIENKKWNESHHGAEQENVAHILDKLHFRKIDNYDCVLIVNPNNYIGERTAIEIDYAKGENKPIFYWDSMINNTKGKCPKCNSSVNGDGTKTFCLNKKCDFVI